jgi:(4S)-4-hydroxy-5-phosphonooxypentane-2,3-dione isomerase
VPGMPKVAVTARVRAKDGRAEELIAAFGALLEQVQTEPGTLLYVVNRSTDDPHLFWVYELYTDDDAFAAHSGSDAMAAAGPVLREIIAESELIVGEPLSGKALPG